MAAGSEAVVMDFALAPRPALGKPAKLATFAPQSIHCMCIGFVSLFLLRFCVIPDGARMIRLLLVSLSILAGLSSPARADALLDAALRAADADLNRPWVVTRKGIDYNSDGSVKHATITQYDSNAPQGQRWSLLSIDGGPPAGPLKAETEAMFKANKLPPTYAMLRPILAGDAVKISDTAQEAQYRLARMAKGTTMVRGFDLSENLEALIIVDKSSGQPFIKEVRIHAPRSFSPLFGSKVNSLSRVMTFRLDDHQRPVFVEHRMDASARVMMKPVIVKAVVSFSQRLDITTAALRSSTSAR
jgi:hypothetical protein